MTSLIDNKK